MTEHLLNCFKVVNLTDFGGTYRTYRVNDLRTGWRTDQSELANLNRLVTMISFEEHIPVSLILAEQPVIAIPSSHELKRLEYQLVPDVLTLRAGEVRSLDLKNREPESLRIAQSFVAFALRTSLWNDRSLWRYSASTYYRKTPERWAHNGAEVSAFSGFGIGTIVLEGELYLVVRLLHKYADPLWLTERCVGDHEMNVLKMRHMLYHWGDALYPVQFLSLTGKSIGEQRFVPDGEDRSVTIFDYTKEKLRTASQAAWIKNLDTNSPAMNYQNPGNRKRKYGAASLCKLLLPTDDAKVQTVHRRSIKQADERLAITQDIVRKYLKTAFLDAARIIVSETPLRYEGSAFSVPAQLFGNGKVLEMQKDRIPLSKLGSSRLGMLRDRSAGPFASLDFKAQFLIAPLSLPRSIVEDFKRRIEEEIASFVHKSFVMELVVYDNRKATTLKSQVEAIICKCKEINARGYGILILPPSSRLGDVHNYVKRELWEDIQLQCVNSLRLKDFYQRRNGSECHDVKGDSMGRYMNYLKYTALGHLMVNRKWLWALKDPLPYDVYIGVDVLNNTAAFTFVYNNGRDCFVRVKRSEQKEKLLSKQIRTIIYENLREDVKLLKIQPKSVVLHRDGNSFDSEWKGFEEAVRLLQREGCLSIGATWGIVEIHKSHTFGFRIFSERDGKIENPATGSWRQLTDKSGLVCTSGYPFLRQGTANPLYVEIAAGKLDIESVLHGVFALSQLCWMNPEGCCGLPIDVKLADESLKPVAGDADEDEILYGDTYETEELPGQFRERSVLP
ncbi:MAG: hypothetical protein ABSB94_12545 [Syntrophorhabdales bacterium]